MAYFDDADIYCGGSIAAWRSMGATVTILIATDGSKGGDFDPEELAQLRSKEATAAATVLDVNLIQLNFPDGELSQSEEFASRLTTEILCLQPNVLVAHAPNAYHAVFNHNGEVSLKAPILKLVNMDIHGDIRYP